MEKLNCKSLMIGDWIVNTEFGRNIIDTIDTIEPDRVWLKEGHTYVPIKFIIPIPLTSEILEKNGFKKDKYGQMVLNEELGASEIYIVLQDGNDCYWWTINGELVAKIRYVHQLQHALRLCGIEKEIIL